MTTHYSGKLSTQPDRIVCRPESRHGAWSTSWRVADCRDCLVLIHGMQVAYIGDGRFRGKVRIDPSSERVTVLWSNRAEQRSGTERLSPGEFEDSWEVVR